jgi:protein-S-isoprenylcysteine O-methyltransferase Ste14
VETFSTDMESLTLLFLTLVLFGVIHSILARLVFKQWLKRYWGDYFFEGWYRLLYNLFAIVTFTPPALILLATESGDVWQTSPSLTLIFRILQGVGLLGLTVSLLQIDGGQFLGTKQARAWFNRAPLPLPTEPLQVRGVYRLTRHPLYFFSLLVLWFTPTLTLTGLVFNAGVTLYFLLGSQFEERTLLAIFGEDYRIYQKQVAWMIPFVKLPTSNPT